ncbi:tyrosine-type recombinase/integrase [Desulfosediminicola sp.]|uniref:tyrosine-type recombinase/integrase n=1 Tax=Desulfosediminicola sp. TaxID=2886825 RepID=UPI003AF21F0A
MRGRIYTAQRCFHCGGKLDYIESRGHLCCSIHPEPKWQGACVVRFGRKHTKRFKTVLEAERHLTYLRVQWDNDRFDPREWAKNQPLSFLSLRLKYLEYKKESDITTKHLRHIEMVLEKAGQSLIEDTGRTWDRTQIKEITEPEIEDFLIGTKGIANKTRSNWKTVLHDFWSWLVRREKRKSKVPMPQFPVVNFNMKMKKLVSIEQQQEIIDEVKRISCHINPRIWLGISLLALYPRIRPGEMANVQEGHINLNENWIVFPQPKEREPKFIHLLPEVAAQIRELRNQTPAMPHMYFFRHLKPRKGVKAGTKFGPKYFNVWWKRACENLGIEEVAVYAGTKHSTCTALGKFMSPEEIKHNVSGHTSKAFERYYLPDHNEKIEATRKVAEMQGRVFKGEVIPIKSNG